MEKLIFPKKPEFISLINKNENNLLNFNNFLNYINYFLLLYFFN